MTRALKAANKYAPKPGSSAIMYGAVAVVLLGLAALIFGRFYDIDILAHPILIGVGAIAIFGVGVWLRRRRKREHVEAVSTEYEHDKDK